MHTEDAIVIFSTAWGSKHGGLNAFSTRLCKALPTISQNVRVYCVCLSATEDDIVDAETSGVRLVNLNFSGSKIETSWSTQITSLICNTDKMNVLWWVGHDIITGELALKCKEVSGGKFAVFMHMSYSDYAYVKHSETDDAIDVSDKVELQKRIFKSADKRFAVGPLLYDRMRELTNHRLDVEMIIPGLSEFVEETQKKDRISAISFGRYERSESVTKQGPLAVVSFARAVKTGNESFTRSLIEADLTIIGVTGDVGREMKDLAYDNAGRLVNIKAFPFIEDQEKLRSLLEDCNVCLMLSWHEGFGLTAWEAISTGIPIIISKNSGVYRLIEKLGGAALGCINYVDVKGANDGIPYEPDIVEVSNKIVHIASNIPMAISNAISLRTLLRGQGYSWAKCAQSFAEHLELKIIESSINIYENSTTGDILEGFDLSLANKLLESAKSYTNLGSYSQALETLEELKKNNEVLSKSYSLSMDIALLESEIYLKQNNYPLAKALVTRVTSLVVERQDWIRYIKVKSVENIILRDQGNYASAIKTAEDIINIAESKVSDAYLLECSYRKYARSLALGGDWRIALEYGLKAAEMVEKRGKKKGECASLLAIAESYRHGLDFENAKIWYKKSRDQAAQSGNTDCYLWAVLGLADTLFLMEENPQERLEKIEKYIEDNENIYLLEKLHVKLSLYAIDVKYNLNKKYPTELIEAYTKLGIPWPRIYVDDILNGDFSHPKKF